MLWAQNALSTKWRKKVMQSGFTYKIFLTRHCEETLNKFWLWTLRAKVCLCCFFFKSKFYCCSAFLSSVFFRKLAHWDLQQSEHDYFFGILRKNKKNGLVVSKLCCPIFSQKTFFLTSKRINLLSFRKTFRFGLLTKLKTNMLTEGKTLCIK